MITMAIETTIREMETREIGAVRDVLARANAQFATLVPPALFERYLQDVLDIESRLDRSTTLVALQDGAVAGTVTYFRDANDEAMGPAIPLGTAGIRAVAVDPARRGAGLGHRLAAAAVELARQDSANGIVLHTWFVMRAATRVYEAVGFRRAPTFDSASTDFFPSSDGADVPALAYWLDL